MCGRYTLTSSPETVASLFDLTTVPDYLPRYNVAPTQEAPIVRVLEHAAGRRLDLVRWGLVPFWADDPSIGNRLINARSETAAEKPSFRDAFKRRRCLVVSDGFFEWKKEGGGKQPYWIHRPDGAPFAFAGLWSRWDKGKGKGKDEGGGDAPLDTFTILTRDAHPDIAAIHPRMPVVLGGDAWEPWLDPEGHDTAALGELLRTADGAGLVARRVSRRVNSPANDVPEVLNEAAPEEAADG